MAEEMDIIVTFWGTEPKTLKDWLTNADFELVDGSFGKGHDGSCRALRRVWCKLLQAVQGFQDKGQELWLTGPGLGAALATPATSTLRAEDKPVYGLYTSGQPMTGDRNFAASFNLDFKPRFSLYQ